MSCFILENLSETVKTLTFGLSLETFIVVHVLPLIVALLLLAISLRRRKRVKKCF